MSNSDEHVVVEMFYRKELIADEVFWQQFGIKRIMKGIPADRYKVLHIRGLL